MTPLAQSIGRLASYLRLTAALQAQGLRFVIAGGVVALASLGTTIGLAGPARVPFQVALAVAVVVALTLHFTLQRFFVWRSSEAFALRLHQQLWRYLAVAAAQYGLTAAITATVPDLLGVSVTPVYIVTLGFVGLLNFLIFRRIFHAFRGDDKRHAA